MVLLDTGTPGTSREIFSEDADGETRTRNPSVINRELTVSLLVPESPVPSGTTVLLG